MNLEAFKQLGKRAQRIRIAKDVLERLKLEKFKEIHGRFSVIPGVTSFFDGHKSAKKVLEANQCHVCAKGALVMSWVAQFNQKKLSSVLGHSRLKEIDSIFPEDMRNAMEAAFERFPLFYGGPLKEHRLTREKKRWTLEQVMQNIVDNRGHFVYKGVTFGKVKAKKKVAA
jgi:hypothetical protein